MNSLKMMTVLAGVTMALTGGAMAQTMRASCDNRAGMSFADVVDSSDATQSSYNVDPSEIYRSFSNISFPVSQSSGTTSATANLMLNSMFLGANPGTRITGFISNNSGSAATTRGTLTAQAQSQDNTRICFDVSGASAATPLLIRVRGAITTTGGATALVRLRNPSLAILTSITGGALNRVIRITTNGTYSFDATFDTGFMNVSTGTGTQTRSAAVSASVTCLADYNGSGTITVQDIFDFLSGYFAGDLAADVNVSGAVSVQDIFDFLAVYFTGCV